MKSLLPSLVVLLSACASAQEPECEPLVEKSLTEACGQPCASLAEWDCTPIVSLVQVKVEQGCGFVRFAYMGDLGDTWGRIYAADSGKVVHVWNRVFFNDGCSIGAVAGEEPTCSDWQPDTCVAK
jgi:hypothetical protein